MESKPTHSMAPVETFTPNDEAHEAKCLETASSNMLGAVYVGKLASADNFCESGELQARI